MNCYAIVNNGNQSLKRLGDKIIISLSRQKIFAKYRAFGRIITLESEHKLTETVLNGRPVYPCIFTSSKEKEIYRRMGFYLIKISKQHYLVYFEYLENLIKKNFYYKKKRLKTYTPQNNLERVILESKSKIIIL